MHRVSSTERVPVGAGDLERERTEPITGGVAVEAHRCDRAKLTLMGTAVYVNRGVPTCTNYYRQSRRLGPHMFRDLLIRLF